MKKKSETQSDDSFPLPLTEHARVRMHQRGLSVDAIRIVMTYGRSIRVRGAEIFVIGRKEVVYFQSKGMELSRFQGVQVVCSTDGAILTAYRNNDFRGLHERVGCRTHQKFAA